MEFQDSFEIPAPPSEVMRRFTDVERISLCVPGLTMTGRDDDDGGYLGVMTVAFGPKRLKFQGKVRCEFDLEHCKGTLTGGGAAAGRSASIQVRTGFSVEQAPGATAAAPRSVVRIVSHADLQGVLAQFAGTGGIALGRQLMRDFARNLTDELSKEVVPAPDSAAARTGSGDRPMPPPARSVSAFRLLLAVAVAKLKGLFHVGSR
ncbi:MAG TPA: SRPBCC domain-containing protein [Bordetella sp.]